MTKNNIDNNKKCCIWGCQNPVYDKFLEETDGTGMCGWLWYCKEHFLERARFLHERTITRMEKENKMSLFNKHVDESTKETKNERPMTEEEKENKVQMNIQEHTDKLLSRLTVEKPIEKSIEKPINQPITEYHKGSFDDRPVVGQPIDNKPIDIEPINIKNLEKDLEKDKQLWDEQEQLYEEMLNSSIEDIYKKLYTLIGTAKAAADITPTNKKNRQMFDQEMSALIQIEELTQDIREHLKERDAYKED